MKGPQFWIMMAVLAFLAWLGVRYFAQSVAENVTGSNTAAHVMEVA